MPSCSSLPSSERGHPAGTSVDGGGAGAFAFEIVPMGSALLPGDCLILSGRKDSDGGSGSIGGIGFSPIINPPEVGILGISRARNIVKIDNESILEKTILPFSLSYDHRVINGVDAGNFMSYIKSTIEKGL